MPDKFTPTLNEQQLKDNISALQKQGMQNADVQRYVDNYKKSSDGSYSLKSASPSPDMVSSVFPGRGTAPTAPAPNTNADKASFVATGDESPLSAAGHVLGNLPSSALNFGKSVFDFLNPLNTIKTAQNLGTNLGDINAPQVSVGDVVKEIPGAAYKTLVPQFLQHIFSGDLKSAAASLENDPVGQIAPLLLVARGAAEKAGVGEQFDNAMTSVSKIVTKPVGAAVEAVGTGASQVLGASTGGGASSIKQAFNAASEGAPALKSFTDAMRGNTQPTDVIKSAEDIVNNIKTNRSSAYVDSLKKIGEDTTSHDISAVTNELPTQLQKFGIKVGNDGLDFSRSSIANNSTARADIQGVYDTVKSWGSQPGDRTGVGLDLLKKQLDDFYSPTSQGRAFVQGIKSKVTGILNTEVKGYKDMTTGYAKTSALLDEIKSATGVGTKAKPDTVFTKLTTAMKGDKEFRLEVLKQMEQTDPQIMNKIAGINLSTWTPRGLVGKGIDVTSALSALVGHFNPQLIPALMSTSPRIVGEFVRAVGMAKESANQVVGAISTLKKANIDVTGVLQGIQKKIQETPNSQGGFFRIPGTPVKTFNDFPSSVQKFMSDYADRVTSKDGVTLGQTKSVQGFFKRYGYNSPTDPKEIANFINTAQESAMSKGMDARSRQNPIAQPRQRK